MSIAIAMLFVMVGNVIGFAVRAVRRDAAAARYRCPWDRPWSERQWRLQQALVGPGQWIDTEEVGMPPDAVEQVSAASGWRVQAAFQIDARAWMLWVVPPTPVPPTTPRSGRRPVLVFLLALAAGVLLPVGISIAEANPSELTTALVLAAGVVLGVVVGIGWSWRDPLVAPRRVLWADLTAQFTGDRARIYVWRLPWRYRLRLVRQLAQSLGYRPSWGGRRRVLAFERDHQVRPSPAVEPRRWTAGP